MIKYIFILLISGFLCSLFAKDIEELIGLTMSMGFFVGIVWELISYYIKGNKNQSE